MAFIDLFVKPDEVQGQEVGAATVTQSVQSSTQRQESDKSVVQSSVSMGASHSISADENIVNMIWDKIISENRPGPDYLELKNNVDALEDLPISNEQKLVSSFKVLKKNYPNFKKDDITKAIDFYIGVVNGEKEEGMRQFDEMRSSKIDGAEIEIKSMQDKAEELKRQYDELQANIGAKTLELTQAKSDIEMKYNSFIGSVDAVMNVLDGDKKKILSINFE